MDMEQKREKTGKRSVKLYPPLRLEYNLRQQSSMGQSLGVLSLLTLRGSETHHFFQLPSLKTTPKCSKLKQRPFFPFHIICGFTGAQLDGSHAILTSGLSWGHKWWQGSGLPRWLLLHIWPEGWDGSPRSPSTWAALCDSWILGVTIPSGQAPGSDSIILALVNGALASEVAARNRKACILRGRVHWKLQNKRFLLSTLSKLFVLPVFCLFGSIPY